MVRLHVCVCVDCAPPYVITTFDLYFLLPIACLPSALTRVLLPGRDCEAKCLCTSGGRYVHAVPRATQAANAALRHHLNAFTTSPPRDASSSKNVSAGTTHRQACTRIKVASLGFAFRPASVVEMQNGSPRQKVERIKFQNGEMYIDVKSNPDKSRSLDKFTVTLWHRRRLKPHGLGDRKVESRNAIVQIWAPCGTAPRPKHSNVVGAWPGVMFVFVPTAGRPMSSSVLICTFYFPSRAYLRH